MAKNGLVSKIVNCTIRIDSGRKGFAIKGKAEDGRVTFEKGIADAMTAFQEVQKTADVETIFIAEYAFITQELQLCDKTDSHTINSLNSAVQGFDDAFLCLEVMENKNHYKIANKTHSTYDKYRMKGLPKDSFHIACNSHVARIKNLLKAPLDLTEKDLLKQRLSNIKTALNCYIEKQKKALSV